MKTFFASDFHFGHTNILYYDKPLRNFKNIWEHDEAIINNYNSLVSDEDDFYFLGDFSMKLSTKYIENYFKALKGNKYFLKGNHDKKNTIRLYERYGEFLGELVRIIVNDQPIVLCHYKLATWQNQAQGAWHLFGHSHGSFNNTPELKTTLCLDVGIHLNDMKPFEFNQIKELMNVKGNTGKIHKRTD